MMGTGEARGFTKESALRRNIERAAGRQLMAEAFFATFVAVLSALSG
jgi:hypothetical protein